MPPIKINGESNVVMRHGECPRYADAPCAWLDWQCTPALRPVRRSILGIPLYYLLILGVFRTHSQPTKIKFAT